MGKEKMGLGELQTIKHFGSELENSRFPRNIRAKLGGSPEYWGEYHRENLELNTLGIFHQIFHGI